MTSVSINFARAVDLKPSPTQKAASSLSQNNNNTDDPSSKLTAVIFGTISAGIVTILIKLGEWYFSRRRLKRNLQQCLYFEIDNHKIVELGFDSEQQPDFALGSFNDIFYRSNLSDITRILPTDMVQRLIFYYSHLKLAYDYQNDLFQLNEKLRRELPTIRTVSDEMKIQELSEKKSAVKDSIRILPSTAQFVRHNLLVDLRKTFKQDPSGIKFIDVLPQYQDWFKTVNKDDDK
jgi:hypothetical protein